MTESSNDENISFKAVWNSGSLLYLERSISVISNNGIIIMQEDKQE